MKKHSFSRFALLGLLAVTVIGSGCGPKHVPPTPPPDNATAPAPTAPPARPTVTLQASSTFIQRGESATLTWSSTNATSLTLNPAVGTVAPEGSSKVSPTESTTYTITATGPGGTADQSIRITVSAVSATGSSQTTRQQKLLTNVPARSSRRLLRLQQSRHCVPTRKTRFLRPRNSCALTPKSK